MDWRVGGEEEEWGRGCFEGSIMEEFWIVPG